VQVEIESIVVELSNAVVAEARGAAFSGASHLHFPRYSGRGFHLPSRPRQGASLCRAAALQGLGWEATLNSVNLPATIRYGASDTLYAAWRDGADHCLAIATEAAISRNADLVRRGGGCMSFYVAHEVARNCADLANDDAIYSVLIPIIRSTGILGSHETDATMPAIVRSTLREVRQHLRERAIA